MKSRNSDSISKKKTIKLLLDSFLLCKKQIARMLGRIVRPSEIEDIVQETFVQTYATSRKREIHYPQAFMMRVARNIALDHLGKAENKRNCSLEDIDESLLLSDLDTEIRYQSEERFMEFCRAVSTLPVNCRRVFILKKVYGFSHVEIGEFLGISTSTVEKHVSKGLSMVIENMEETVVVKKRKQIDKEIEDIKSDQGHSH